MTAQYGSDRPFGGLDLDIAERYFSGALSVGEAADFERSVAASPLRQRTLEDLRSIWERYRRAPGAWDTSAMWAAVASRTGVHMEPSASDIAALAPRRPARVPSWMMRAPRQLAAWQPMVAGLAALLVLGAGLWTWQGRRAAVGAGAWVTYHTPRGQRATVQLRDGSKITLAAESQLRVRLDDGSARVAELSGQAYFEVAHDGARPFVVRTATGRVTELGTAFTVRAYPDDSVTSVVVAAGRVALTPARLLTPAGDDTALLAYGRGRMPSGAVVLAAGDAALLARGGVSEVERGVDVAQSLAWTSGELRFVNAPLSTVIRAIERSYDVKVELADPAFAAYPLTVSIREGSVDGALDVVTKSVGLHYERRGAVLRVVAVASRKENQ